MKAHTPQRRKKTVLSTVAVSIGETLGTLAAKAIAAQEALSDSPVAASVKRNANALIRKVKVASGQTAGDTAAKHTGRRSRRATATPKHPARTAKRTGRSARSSKRNA